MSTLTKSPIRVAREALAVATKALRPYAPKYSPQLYTQPQLFVCLVLKVFFKTDYRGSNSRRVLVGLAMPAWPAWFS